MSQKPPTKRYRYECKCGKNPMSGTVSASPFSEVAIFAALEIGWAQSHNRPGCSIKSKTVELYSKKKQEFIAESQVAGDEFRPGLPSETLRKVWAQWEDNYGAPWHFGADDKSDAILSLGKFRPRGKTWADVEAMAARESPKCRLCRNSGIATAVDAIESGKAINPRPAVCIACNGSGDSDNPRPEPLPIWRAYLERLDREGIKAGGMAAKDRALYPDLAELDTLRLSVLTAKGRVSVPEQVAKHMLINGGGRHPAGEWTAEPSDGAGKQGRNDDQWRRNLTPQKTAIALSAMILAAGSFAAGWRAGANAVPVCSYSPSMPGAAGVVPCVTGPVVYLPQKSTTEESKADTPDRHMLPGVRCGNGCCCRLSEPTAETASLHYCAVGECIADADEIMGRRTPTLTIDIETPLISLGTMRPAKRQGKH